MGPQEVISTYKMLCALETARQELVLQDFAMEDNLFTGVLETLFMYKQFKHFAINYLCLSLVFA